MKASPFLATVLNVTIISSLLSQSPPQHPAQPSTPTEDEVVSITTNLVQIDAVVTDQDGKLVTDLSAEDFEILEDKRPQPIGAFSYVSAEKTSASSAPPPLPDVKNAPPLPPAPLRADQVRRTIVFVVDDLGLSFSSFIAVQSGLKNFMDQQMRPGDLAAIVRTSGGAAASTHELDTATLYDASLLEHYRARVLPDATSMRLIALAPSFDEARLAKSSDADDHDTVPSPAAALVPVVRDETGAQRPTLLQLRPSTRVELDNSAR